MREYHQRPIQVRPAASHKQQGMALIMVLVIVLLLGIAGTIAIRSSQTSLDMTTATQVNQLLFQASDVPLTKISTEVKDIETGISNQPEVINMQANDMDPLRFLALEGEQQAAEYVLCYQPTTHNMLYNQPSSHRILLAADGSKSRGSNDGYCKITDTASNYFTSARQVVATQVSLSRRQSSSFENHTDGIVGAPFESSALGIDEDSVKAAKPIFIRAVSTSVIPIMASSQKKVEDCLTLASGAIAGNTITDNQTHCLNVIDVPKNIQVQDYAYINGFE